MTIKDIFQETDRLKQQIENLSVEALKQELAENPDLLLLDIREIQERVDLGAIPGSRHCPRGMLEFWASPNSPYYRDYFRENRRTIVYCAGGGRSVFSTLALLEMGFTDVAHLEPGFSGWLQAGETSEDIASTSKWRRRE